MRPEWRAGEGEYVFPPFFHDFVGHIVWGAFEVRGVYWRLAVVLGGRRGTANADSVDDVAVRRHAEGFASRPDVANLSTIDRHIVIETLAVLEGRLVVKVPHTIVVL